MRAGCPASTFVLFAEWEGPCTQVALGPDPDTRKGR